MNTPDSRRPDPALDVAGSDGEPDDVEGHRMFTPDQAQHRSDLARMERERRAARPPSDGPDDVTG